jgi:hypothetical protein
VDGPRAATRATGAHHEVDAAGSRDHPLRHVNAINHIRVPAVMAATMFLVFFPLILGDGKENYVNDVGHDPPDFLARWLLICAVLFGASAVAYAVRLRRGRG